MSCERVSELVTDYLAGTLSASAADEVKRHLEACPDCRAEIESLEAFWQQLGLLPDEEPSARLRERFYETLEEFQRREAARPRRAGWERLLERLEAWWATPRPRRFAVALSSLALGLVVGGLLGERSRRDEIEAMSDQVESLREVVALSLLRQGSASARLRGVSYGREVASRDERVVEALIEVATGDPSANVRLAAIDALGAIDSRPAVRDRLASSLGAQRSPLVQMAVVDLLMQRGPGAGEEIGRLLAEESLDASVRAYLEEISVPESY